MACSTPSTTYNKGWILLDLAEIKKPKNITIYFNSWNSANSLRKYPGAAPSNYDIFVSKDNTNWEKVYSFVGSYSDKSIYNQPLSVTVDTSGKDVRYVKLQHSMVYDGTGWCLAVKEIKVEYFNIPTPSNKTLFYVNILNKN